MHTGDGSETHGAEGGAITVRRDVPTGTEGRVAELYWEAFGRKLGAALDPPDKGRRFIATHLHRDRGVVALAGDHVVGVAGFQLGGRGLTGGGPADVLRTYGAVRGLPRLALLALLERTPAPGQLVMDGIAVDAGHRGRGIGSALLEEIARVAAGSGCDRIRLDVIDVNPRARALYERHGFTAVRTEQTPYLRRLMGFTAVTTMHRSVGDRRDETR
ncbi:GNAT family N-acetyltransferase [Couchioplanes caeruleus]|uniref:Molybdopterin-guanine dinucleotide biosynthesis protein MobC n=2 Tax=Couchioplanes caeruleus TaxID=56438 RepID=A0A1K0FIM8_9ACTN|nr:GNAT family N-acetyltransferase [Couchioplanes caeruleus]OJF12681.1 molybdopterin-guanine dinucleotide biosynthesis protein MobC [Couchioplanes caeruleus subsp. caeruleus]ROP27461.1 acetyltransferase (GNAT) family protein [Couchioplanes caeruleus]